MLTLKTRLINHPWHAQPDNFQVMEERLSLIKEIKNIPLKDLEVILKDLPGEVIGMLAIYKLPIGDK